MFIHQYQNSFLLSSGKEKIPMIGSEMEQMLIIIKEYFPVIKYMLFEGIARNNQDTS